LLAVAPLGAQAQAPEDNSATQSASIPNLTLEDVMERDVVFVNVLGTHVHLARQWMLSYQPMVMRMSGIQDGTRGVSTDDLLTRYDMAPVEMTDQMHMGMVMYAPSDVLTFAATIPYSHKRMTHAMAGGLRAIDESHGFGDVTVGALYAVGAVKQYRHRFLINAAVSLPTGSINAMSDGDQTAPPMPLDYRMQLGSGTFDVLPGFTYLGHTTNWAFGEEVVPRLRLGTNSRGYRLGNEMRLRSWASRRLTDWVGVSGALEYMTTGNIHGADPELDPKLIPTNDPGIQGSRVLDATTTLEFYVPQGMLKGQRLALEGVWPVHQRYDGPQLRSKWELRVGWQWIFYGPRSRS